MDIALSFDIMQLPSHVNNYVKYFFLFDIVMLEMR